MLILFFLDVAAENIIQVTQVTHATLNSMPCRGFCFTPPPLPAHSGGYSILTSESLYQYCHQIFIFKVFLLRYFKQRYMVFIV